MKVLGIITPIFAALLIQGPSAQANIGLTPSSITLSATRRNIQAREILIQTNSSTENIELISTDLKNTDGSTIFPAKLIQFEPIETQPTPWKRYRVNFNLGDQLHSGEYIGNIILKNNDRKQEIPVTLRLRDPFWRVLPVLLLGVGIGVGLSTYRNERLTHDEILVSAGRLRNQMRADSELIRPFSNRINSFLEQVDDALEQKQWDAAQEKLDSALIRWQAWKEDKEVWLAQIDYLTKLVDIKNKKIDRGTTFSQAIQSRLNEAERNVSELDTPKRFRELLEELHQYINSYLEGKHLWEQFNELVKQVRSESKGFWKQRSLDNLNQLNQLIPTSIDSFNKSFLDWKKNIGNELDEIEKNIKNKEEAGQAIHPDPRMSPRALVRNNSLVQIHSSPEVVLAKEESRVKRANKRIQLWKIGAYLSSLILLTWFGFEQLYGSKPTFGAKPSEDYLALVAWGFGLEVSRDSVVKVMQSLGIGNQE